MSAEKYSELAKRLDHLEDKVKRMVEVCDPERFPFIYLTIEQDWTRKQVDALFKLMEDVEASLSTPKKIGLIEFERRVKSIIPNGDYQIAKSIVMTFGDQHKYMDAYRYLKNDGMNIPEPE